jgi:hypothetical protein
MGHPLKLALTMALAVLAGCGGGGDPNMGMFSCDFTTTAHVHQCIDNAWSGGVYPTTDWAASCKTHAGTTGSGCSHGGSVGGCQQSATSGMISLTATTWYYSGKAADYMGPCASAGGVFVMP